MEKWNKKYKIFIIDDDKFLLDMYSIKFKEHGLEVTTFLSSQEALSQFENNNVNPDIILLDLVMPIMDGFELLKKIRDNKLVPSARIVVLSNLGEQADIKKAEQYKIDGYIVKASATPSEVLDMVKGVLEKTQK